jgi:aryl-alcohol dehydrogenase-like predicted oxidoreductase
MRYTNLGRTGLKISVIALGCGNFGGIGSIPSLFGKVGTREEAFAIMDRAWELGINYFDTANSYGGGLSESFIGEWLKQKGASVRDQLILSTKVRSPVGDGPNDQGLSRRHILQQIDASLRRLGIDYLDLYITHAPDPSTPLEETLPALDDLIHQGKVRYIGAANMPAWLLTKALWISDRYHLQRFEWVQNSYSLLDQTDELEMFPLCQDQHLGHTPFSPLAGGWLTGKYRAGEPFPAGSRMDLRPDYRSLVSEKAYPALENLHRYATERGVDMASLALAWVMSHPLVTAPVIGPRRAEHLDIVNNALEIKLDAEERAKIAGFFKDNNPAWR